MPLSLLLGTAVVTADAEASSLMGQAAEVAVAGQPPALKGVSRSATRSSRRSLRIRRPQAVAAGDVMVAGVVARVGARRLEAPAGWTAVQRNGTGRRGRLAQAVFIKVAGLAEPAVYRWALGARSTAAGGILAYSGVDVARPVDGHSGRMTKTGRLISPAFRTAMSNVRVVSFFGHAGAMRTTTPASAVERFDTVSRRAGANAVSSQAADFVQTAAGVTGSMVAQAKPRRRARAASARQTIGQMVGLRPAPSAASGFGLTGVTALVTAPPADGLPAQPDVLPPDTEITGGPSGATASQDASFSFTSEPGATFECRLDVGPWSTCSSPKAYAGLSEGAHVFQVRAIDLAGNVDPLPAVRSWVIATGPGSDTTPPDTTITSGPTGVTNVADATFEFSSTESGSSFECRLDSGTWTACTSPKGYSGVADGSHTVQVRATDAAGNVDASPASRTWSVDTTDPVTSVTGGPSGTTSATTASLSFTSEAGATFECRLDGGAWGVCTSPKAYSGLSEGAHTFRVRATDAAGNTDASPATRTWTVDSTAPDTTISGGPTGSTTETTASFSFSASEGGSTFACRLDAGAWGACTSPKSYSGLAEGSHTFEVRATDGAGNTDGSPASRTWTVADETLPDLTAPETTITAGPSGTTTTASASLSFSSSEGGSTFACRIDGGAWAACTSPKAYSGLANGSHTFDVRATDAAGNTDATPASRTWTVNVTAPDTTPPDTTISSGPTGTTTETSASFAFSSSESGSTFACRLDGGAWGACTSPKAYSAIGTGAHTFQVRATDAAGNVDASPASRSWTVQSAPPTGGKNCMADPSVCGFPDVETVGVTPGTQLTPVNGVVTLSQAGMVYENKLVTGTISVTAPNVTIRNVKLVATDEYYGIRAFGWQNNVSGLLVEDVEIDLNGRLGIKGIAFDGYTARNVFFHNGSDCAHFGSDVTIEDSLCMSGPDANDDGWPDSTGFCNGEEHFDGLQSDGGEDIIIRHNTIRNPCSQTSAILMSTNTSAIRDVTISDNLMAGGGYTLYCNAGPDVANETVTGNRFARTWYSKSGYWGATTGCEDADVNSGNVWDDTGAPM